MLVYFQKKINVENDVLFTKTPIMHIYALVYLVFNINLTMLYCIFLVVLGGIKSDNFALEDYT